MAAKSEVYKGEPIRSGALWIALVAEIVSFGIVLTAVTLAGQGHIVLSEPWLSLYQLLVRWTAAMPAISTLCLLFWIFRANKNARALSIQSLATRSLENSAGWAVGWFFVPVANLWKPFEVMREIYKASRTPHDWRKAQGASIVGWWWAIHIFGNLFSVFLIILKSEGNPITDREMAMAFYAVVIVHQTLLFVITTRIVKWQAKAHRLGGIENVF